jgi:predicted carbohydrate-binding protein with CBM5 and CBM33 domain
MRSLTAICFIALVVYVAAHGHLTSPAARTAAEAAPQEAVCGGVARKAITATWEAKSQQTIRWNIAADHGGNIYGYIITDNSTETQTNFNKNMLFGPIKSKGGDASATFTVPDVSCDSCVIQWLWQSDETPYYGCSDVKITGGSNAIQTPNGLCFGGLVRCGSASTSYIHVGLLLMAIVALLL